MNEMRKLVAILAADIVGFTRLAGADEDRTLARLRALRGDLIDPAIGAHQGRVVKRTGDGVLVEYRSVVDAVRCAIEIQNGMVERNAGLPADRRIEFRIGVHIGDVVEESDGDLMGDGVNIAARLEGVAKPGAICLSEDAYRQVRPRLDLAVSDLGETRLKNVVEPIRVYSLSVGGHAKAATKKRPVLAMAAAIVAVAALAAAGGAFLWTRATPGDPSSAMLSQAARPSVGTPPPVALPASPPIIEPTQTAPVMGRTAGADDKPRAPVEVQPSSPAAQPSAPLSVAVALPTEPRSGAGGAPVGAPPTLAAAPSASVPPAPPSLDKGASPSPQIAPGQAAPAVASARDAADRNSSQAAEPSPASAGSVVTTPVDEHPLAANAGNASAAGAEASNASSSAHESASAETAPSATPVQPPKSVADPTDKTGTDSPWSAARLVPPKAIKIDLAGVTFQKEIAPYRQNHLPEWRSSIILSGDRVKYVNGDGAQYETKIGQSFTYRNPLGEAIGIFYAIEGDVLTIRAERSSFYAETRIRSQGGNECSATLEFHLKPGHNTFDMRRSSNGESMSLSEEKVRSISCSVSNAAQPAAPEARQAPSDQQAALTPQAAAPAAGTLPNGNDIGTAPPIYDREDEDFGVTPMPRIYNGQHGSFEAPTPTTIAGAETITTWALKAMIAAGHPPPVLIDALDGNLTASLPNAIWLPRAGYGGVLGDELQAKLGAALTKLTHGDKAQPIVFFCRSRTCWLSHNAVLRAVALGYSKVYWYRGGRQAWIAAGLDLERIAARPLF